MFCIVQAAKSCYTRVYLKSRKFSLFLQAQLDFALNSLEIHKGFLRLFALNPACACEIFVIFFVFRYTLGRPYAVPSLSALPSFLFRTALLYQIHNKYATKTENFIQKERARRFKMASVVLWSYSAERLFLISG